MFLCLQSSVIGNETENGVEDVSFEYHSNTARLSLTVEPGLKDHPGVQFPGFLLTINACSCRKS